MKKVNFRDFLDYGNKIRAAYNVLCYKGACSGDYFCEWYGKILHKLTGNANITLEEVHQNYGCRLVISVVNVSKRRLEFWDYKIRPKMPLVLAVRASMSIEGIFMPVEIDGDLYVDGGTLCNYPIKAFHYNGMDGDIINPHTLGLMLMSDDELSAVYPPINTLLEYSTACIECLWTQPQKIYMDAQDWARTIKIPTGKISSIDFNITRGEVNALVEAGKTAVTNYLNGVKTFGKNTFHCIRSPHTVDDELPVQRKYSNPALLASHNSDHEHNDNNRNDNNDNKRHSVHKKQTVSEKRTEVSEAQSVLHVPKPKSDDWDSMIDGLVEITEEKDASKDLPKDKKSELIKRTVGSSPPIAINQFHLE